MINGLFVQVGWKFIANRGNPEAFEPAPNPEAFAATKAPKAEVESYTVNVNGQSFDVAVAWWSGACDFNSRGSASS